jgi:CubicO group peptidase (beta-lactamase class C family)
MSPQTANFKNPFIIKTKNMKHLKNSTIFLLMAFLSSCSLFSKEVTDETPLTVIVVESFKPLEDVWYEYMKENKITGGVSLVFQKGEMVFHKAYGYSDIENQIPFELNDIFRIASMTKPITAVAAMMLHEEGKFELDDPVSKFIPGFAHLEILDSINPADSSYVSHPATRPMTIRHLFTHSSGLFYGFDSLLTILLEKAEIAQGFEERDILLADNVNRLAQLPIMHEPGEKYTYGLGIDVLGRLVEIWSGKPLDMFFSERIFNPLGMKDTHFYLPEEKYSRLVPVNRSTDSGAAPAETPNFQYPIKGAKTFLSGGADLSSTAYDYFLFCKMMLQKGELNGVRILQPETVDMITSVHFESDNNDMGLGFGIHTERKQANAARSVGSFAWGGFFSTTFWVDPAEDLIAVHMLQKFPFWHWEIHKDFEDTIYKIVLEKKQNKPTS